MSITRYQSAPGMSQAVRAGGFLFVAGQVAEGANAAKQTAVILAKFDALLSQTGMDRAAIVSANIWLADIADFAAMKAVWDEWVVPAPRRRGPVCIGAGLPATSGRNRRHRFRRRVPPR